MLDRRTTDRRVYFWMPPCPETGSCSSLPVTQEGAEPETRTDFLSLGWDVG